MLRLLLLLMAQLLLLRHSLLVLIYELLIDLVVLEKTLHRREGIRLRRVEPLENLVQHLSRLLGVKLVFLEGIVVGLLRVRERASRLARRDVAHRLHEEVGGDRALAL